MLEDSVVMAVVSQLFDKYDFNRSYTLEGQELGGFFNEAFHMLRLQVPVLPEEIEMALKKSKGVASKEELVNAIFLINSKRKAQFLQHGGHNLQNSLLVGVQVLPTVVPQQQQHTVSMVGNTTVYPGPPHPGMPMPMAGSYVIPSGPQQSAVRPPSPQPIIVIPPSSYSAQYTPNQSYAPQLQHYDMRVSSNLPVNPPMGMQQSPQQYPASKPQQYPSGQLPLGKFNQSTVAISQDSERNLRAMVDRMYEKYDLDQSGSLDVYELANTLNAMLAELDLPITFTY